MNECNHREEMNKLEHIINDLQYEASLSYRAKAMGINDPRQRRTGEINEELWRNCFLQKEENLMWQIAENHKLQAKLDETEKKLTRANALTDKLLEAIKTHRDAVIESSSDLVVADNKLWEVPT